MRSLRRAGARAGFTLVEVLIASALLGLSLVVMFGFHSQAVRANMNAHRLTDCTYLAQTQMERMLAMDWTSSNRPTDMTDAHGPDPMTMDMWANLESPTLPTSVNSANTTDPSQGPLLYTVTWDVEDMDAEETWVRMRVRCTYPDSQFATWHGTTISSYRYRDS
jgi:prepilin-type N-terminal cleavage/methylation domain-containing protein